MDFISAGGIVLAAKEGKILCNNTLEQRLSLASEGLLPEIRGILFPQAPVGIDLNKF
jgi:vacuolar-type H+-ATPase subunit E/Vma4